MEGRTPTLLALLCTSLALGCASDLELTNEQYYRMPRLFHLDDYAACLSQQAGLYCVGTFHLTADQPGELYSLMERSSADSFNFNHTRLHRGYCVSARCAQLSPQLRPAERFARCVDDWTRAKHGLRARLIGLDYCQSASTPRGRPVDELDLLFAGVVAAIVFFNLIGTMYDVYRSQDAKPNKMLTAWSLRSNWARLTARYADGDPRLAALSSLQGVKALTMLCVMLAHTVFSHYSAYLANPIFLETAGRTFMANLLTNGSVIVQTFVLVSSFLLAHSLLLHAEKPDQTISLTMLPRLIVHRVVRITPVNLFVVGLAATWWPHSNDGPLWSSRVATECARCRDKFWAQALYVNNFYKPDDHCLIQTWFLAVDMQLYLVSCVLMLALGRWRRLAMKLFAVLFLAAVAGNGAAAYHWGWSSALFFLRPEMMRVQCAAQPSFTWLYSAPWGSFPASALGLFFACFHYEMQAKGFKPNDYLLMRLLYRCSVAGMFAWVFAGYLIQDSCDPLVRAVHAAVDRPVFVFLVAVALYGFFNKIDSLWWEFLSWRGFQVIGRLSLPVLMLHWIYNLALISSRVQTTQTSVIAIGQDWIATIILSYLSAVPLHLLVEVPVQKFLEAFFS